MGATTGALEKLDEKIRSAEMKWNGNITLEMDGKEDTYSPGSIEIDRYGVESIALKATSGDERAIAVIRFSAQECKALITELIHSLK